MSDGLAQSEQKRHEALEMIQSARKFRAEGNMEAAQQEMSNVWAALDQSLWLCPLNHRARFLKVSCAMNVQDFQTAKTEAKRIYEALSVDQMKDMDDSMLHLSIVHACKMIGETDEALRFAREAVQLYPTDPQAYMVLGELCDSMGQIAQAEYMCRQALMNNDAPGCGHPLSPQNVYFTLCCLGSSLVRQGKQTEAEGFLVRAVGIDNGHPLAYKHLSDVYQRQNRMTEALQMAQKSFECDGSDTSMRARIQMLQQQGAADGGGEGLATDEHGETMNANRTRLQAPAAAAGPVHTDGMESVHSERLTPRQVQQGTSPEQSRKAPVKREEPADDWFACCLERNNNCG